MTIYQVVPTVSTSDTWSASQHNTYIRDNFKAIMEDATAGGIPYWDVTTGFASLALGTARQAVRVNAGATAPEYASASLCRVRRTTAQSVNNDSLTDISFNSEVTDTNAMWAVGAPTDVVIPFSGVWLLTGQVSFDTDADGYRSAYIRIDDDETNGATMVVGADAGSNATILNLAGITALTASQVITLTCRHTAGAALNTVAYSTWLSVAFLGP